MEAAPAPSRFARFDRRIRQRTQHSSSNEPAYEQARKEEDPRSASVNEPLLAREQRGRVVMGEGHRQFHRRMAQAQAQASPQSNVATVVVQEMVDSTGNIVAVSTTVMPPVPPAVPAVPTAAIPAVPAVPPFPSDLVVPTVPPFPFPTAAVNPTGTLTLGIPQPPSATSVLATTFPGFNSTSSSASSTLSSSSLKSSSSPSPTSSSTRSSTLSSSSQTSPSPTSSSSSSTPSASSTSSFVGGGGGPNTAAPPVGAPTAAVANSQPSSTPALGTPQVIGTVFGSLAGAALILALILFLIKRHKQKQRGTLQLTGDGDTDQHQPMTQAAARTSYVTPSFLNRFSSLSRSTAESSSGTGERSFQRVSGRKLPSAFSEGMTSEQFAGNQGTLSGSSFYTDDKGFYGGAGVMSKDFGKEIGKEIGETTNTGTVGKDERVMPSPARTPVIHHPEDAPPWGASRNGGASTLSPPQTPVNPFTDPAPPPRGALGRSRLSHDGSRSSRFTENV